MLREYSLENRKFIDEFVNDVEKQLYNCADYAEALAVAWINKRNVLAFGPGGYGKTDLGNLFGEYLLKRKEIKTNPFVLTFGIGMTEERLLGGTDIQKYLKESELSFKLQNSFANYEYVIFEEFFDALEIVLLILKESLMSKIVKNGTQVFPLKTKMILACTNKSPEEVAKNDSLEALIQRFPYHLNVVWNSHNAEDYINAFSKRMEVTKEVELLCQFIAEANYGEDRPISPRSASNMLTDIFRVNNISVLKYGPLADQYRQILSKFENLDNEVLTENLISLTKKACKIFVKKNAEIKSVIASLGVCKILLLAFYKLENSQLSDTNFKKAKEVQMFVSTTITEILKLLMEDINPSTSNWLGEVKTTFKNSHTGDVMSIPLLSNVLAPVKPEVNFNKIPEELSIVLKKITELL